MTMAKDSVQKRVLFLTVGYGQGHHSAAAALAEQYADLGWKTLTADVCQQAQPRLFKLTQSFYQFCVRRAPWLWGITYALTDTADWATMVRRPVLKRVCSCLSQMVCDYKPDLIICTYPLFAYMLDAMCAEGVTVPPYAVVVTDALEISRPWMCTKSRLVMVPDEVSRSLVMERYALESAKVVATGFPVRQAFMPGRDRVCPSSDNLRIVYGAYRQIGGVLNDVEALLGAFPEAQLTVIAGKRAAVLQRRFALPIAQHRLLVLESTTQMPQLLAHSHFYIGKGGAATMFECYAAEVPVLVNFTLPGQERGNLELLIQDGAGRHVESTSHLISTLHELLDANAYGWRAMRKAMQSRSRAYGAARIVQEISAMFDL